MNFWVSWADEADDANEIDVNLTEAEKTVDEAEKMINLQVCWQVIFQSIICCILS